MAIRYTPTNNSRSKSRQFVWLPLAGAAILAVGILLGLRLKGGQGPLIAFSEAAEIEGNAIGVGPVEEVLRFIEAKYVDEVDRERLVDGAVNNLLSELDPHSVYIGPDEVGNHRERLEGASTGIGVNVVMVRDSVTVVSALPGGPAESAGLLPYDRLLSIGDSLVSGRNLTVGDVERYLAQLPEGAVQLGIFRPGVGRLSPVNLSRERVTVPSVGRGVLLGADIAYIRVRQFGTNTYEEFMQQLERLSTDGARHLILDLRGNSGGYLQEAVSMLSQLFIDDGRLLVFTEGAHSPRKEYNSSGRVFFPLDRVAVVIDHGSASASEIVAGAVQDWDRGLVVGQRSFGKGLVQELYSLQDGGALHITVSRYFTPSGRSIQRDYEDLGAYRVGYLDSVEANRPNEYVTVGGRKVYAGGGIAPDVEVRDANVLRTPALAQAMRSLETYAFEQLETIDEQMEAADLLPLLRKHLLKDGIAFTDGDWDYYQQDMQQEIDLRLTAKRLGPSAATRQRLQRDPFIASAIEALEDAQPIAKRSSE